MDIVTVNDSPLRDVTEKCVAIVRFAAPLTPNDIRPGLFFQVTIDPAKIRGDFIRFGTDGDELVGWQPIDFLRVCQLLAKANEGGGFDEIGPQKSLGVTVQDSTVTQSLTVTQPIG